MAVSLYKCTSWYLNLVILVSLSEIDISGMRSKMSIVEQEPRLFNLSLADNIAYGCGKAVTKDDIINAAKRAMIHDFISGLPEQYNTLVGEDGTY